MRNLPNLFGGGCQNQMMKSQILKKRLKTIKLWKDS